uniref:Uncharacterized protein n=1 Tax=Oryza barthii TaxID=65489 RepID=A0A0D3GQT7_9ORYZ
MLHMRGIAPKLTRERGTDDVGRWPDLRKKERISFSADLQRDSLGRPSPGTLATLMAQRLGRDASDHRERRSDRRRRSGHRGRRRARRKVDSMVCLTRWFAEDWMINGSKLMYPRCM